MHIIAKKRYVKICITLILLILLFICFLKVAIEKQFQDCLDLGKYLLLGIGFLVRKV